MAKAATSKPAVAAKPAAARPAAAAKPAAKPAATAAPKAAPAPAKPASKPAAKPPAKPGAAGPKTISPLKAAIAPLIDEAREAAPLVRSDDVVIAQLLDIYEKENAKAGLLLRLVSGKCGDGKAGPYATLNYAIVEPEIAMGQVISHYHGFHDTDWGISQRTGEHRVHTAQDSLTEIFSDLRLCGVDVDGKNDADDKLTVDVIDEDFAGYIKRMVAKGVIGVRARATFNAKRPPGRLNFDILAPAGVLFQEETGDNGGMDVETDEEETSEETVEEGVETTEEETVEEMIEETVEEGAEEGEQEEAPEGVQLTEGSEVEFTIRDKTYEGVVDSFTDDQKSAFIQIEGEANPRKVKIQAITMIDGVEVDFTGA